MPRRKSESGESLVKAAAWAWYQHGSGQEGKAAREFDITRVQQGSKPSRYKLEAMKDADAGHATGSSSKSPSFESFSFALSPTLTDMSLLDPYEIRRIARELGSILESTTMRYSDNFTAHDNEHHPKMDRLVFEKDTITKKMAAWLNGIWRRRGVGMCRAIGEVVQPISLDGSIRKSHSAVIKPINSWPRPSSQ